MSDPKPKDFTEHTVSSKIAYRGTFLDVVVDEVRLPDGKLTRREHIRHPGAVTIVPLLEPGTVVLVRQFRYAVGRHFCEIPAGKIDPGEPSLQAAQRELREECGYQAREWHRLGLIHPCIGYSNESIEIYTARGLLHVGNAPDDGEFLESVTVSMSQALRWIEDGTITDVKTIIGLMWADKFCSGSRKAKVERRK